jgi:DMSO/TMAO reductase YedYZ molybdopterin-dependent catalytic subunit
MTMATPRRAFLVTLVASAVAIGGRIALLPRGLTDDQVQQLGTADEAREYDLRGSMNLNVLAQQLELGPPVFRYTRAFTVNTVELHPQRGLTDHARWSVHVDGLVDHAFELTPDTLTEFPSAEHTDTFHCVEGWGVPNARWRGVQLSDILRRASPQPAASFVTFRTLGGVYSDSLTLEQALRPGTLLATHLDDRPLPDQQGYPIRLVVPFMYGYKSVKWLARVTVEDRRQVGFWERRGWQLDPYV